MALLSELVAVCEKYDLDSRSTLNVFARRLREAGRVSKAGRGRGAAHMTFLDAARFLIACAATDHPERATEAELCFSNLVLSDVSAGITTDFDTSTLDVALAGFLEAINDGSIDAQYLIKFTEEEKREFRVFEPSLFFSLSRGSVSAELGTGEYSLVFFHKSAHAAFSEKDEKSQAPFLAAYEAESIRFGTGKNLNARFNADLLRGVAGVIACKTKSWS